jgi:tRNA A37 threonylcarbamoyladenosine synthetase subunit TsaC/SUA5/YrdC
MSSTLMLPGESVPMTDGEEIRERLENDVDAVIDGGTCGMEPTTVLDLSAGDVAILRKGKGPITGFDN